MRRPLPIVLLVLSPLLGGPPVGAQQAAAPEATLTLGSLPALVLKYDTGTAISAQTTLFALRTFRGTIARALPQIDLSTNYSLAYTPSIEPATGTTLDDRGTHLVDAKLSVSQLLPTAGSLLLSLENAMTITTIGSQDVLGTTTNPDPRYSQAPRISLGITQPLFLNGKLLDFAIFPATLRKAELGYLEQGAADLSQRNQAIGQAVEQYFSIVQLRKSAAQTRRAIDVARGNLAVLQQNYSLGSVAEADLLDVKIALSRQEQGLLELASTLARAERLLAHATGSDGLAGTTLSEEVPRISFALTRQEAVDRAVAAHPLIRKQTLAAEEKRLDQVLGGQQFASTLTLSFSWSPRYPRSPVDPFTQSYMTDFESSFKDLFGDGAGNNYSFAAGLTIHLFDGGSQRESRAASAALGASSEQALLAQRQAVQDQVELDLLQKASLEEKVSLLREAADLAERRLATERSLLSLGKSTDLDVASRESDAEAGANDLWRARVDLYLTVLDLHSLTGDDLVTIIEGSNE